MPEEPIPTSNLDSAKAHAKEAVDATKSHLKEAVDQSKEHLKHAADDLRTAAEAKARELRGKAEQTYGETRERVRTFQEDGEAYIRGNPTQAVITGVVAGFVLGLIFRR
jgi:ElaB/YqjD/DUF883 family membrane-anchored ribosome-binding protein